MEDLLINTYDIDGVIYIPGYTGLKPRVNDFIITGRSFEEREYTLDFLHGQGIYNQVYFSPHKFSEKTRGLSGLHKANIIKMLQRHWYIDVGIHFEDDPIQADIIREKTGVQVVLLVHDLVEKENVWHGPKHQ